MVRLLGIVVLLLAASLFPAAVFAQAAPDAPALVVPHAVCTQVEPKTGRYGVSFYGGTRMCTVIAAYPEAFPWPAVPLDPVKFGMRAMCNYWVTDDHQEYAVAWSIPGYEYLSASYCFGMREGGVPVIFVDPTYN